MKKLLFLSLLTVNTVFSQEYTYSMLNESENNFLDRYSIDYTGMHVRYIIFNDSLELIRTDQLRTDFKTAYANFIKWNNNQFSVLPDTIGVLMNGQEYLESKEKIDAMYIFGKYHNVLNIYTISVDDRLNNVKTIEIVEAYDIRNQWFFHRIFYSNFDNQWTDWSWVKDLNSENLECAPCHIP